ncbi:hypothetical protein QZH41_014035 [Actinostola sp. cb2023]|nr:hypothetical protein QZH41_014035 [Actinostola sp. cb2023]
MFVLIPNYVFHRYPIIEYRIIGKKGEGTFSEVLKVQDIRNGTYFACKKIKQRYDSIDQVNNLREVQAMRRLSPNMNVVELKEIIFDKKNGTLALICELMDMNLYELIRGRRRYVQESKVKNYMYQLCKSIDHMHRNGIFHRDIKPENILIKDDVLKLADFGSCRSVYSKQPYTEYISTRWYRAPECLLTDGYYNHKMDLWGVGCVFFEVMSLHPLFPGSNEVDQIARIHAVLGTPTASVLQKLRKITAKQAIRHPYFKDLRDLERRATARATSPSDMSVISRSNKPLKKKVSTVQQLSILPKEFPSAIIPPPQSNYHPFGGISTKSSVYSNRTVLPKIPLATNMTTSFPTSFPPILNDKNKKVPGNKKYNHYSLPAINKQGGASGF